MRRVLETILPESFSAIPPTNPTAPSAPLNFNVSVIDALVTATWVEPLTRPYGTEYELWSAPFSLSHPDSKSLIFSGNDTSKLLAFSVNSPFWLQVRARANSWYSAYVPSTYGVAVVPNYMAPSVPTGWSATVAPLGMFKSLTTSAGAVSDAAAVTVHNGTTPVFSWHNPGSADIAISFPGSASTTFVASGMSPGNSRAGTFWCRVSDNGGADVASLQVSVNFFREP